jgi:hypothetical protein
MRGNIAPIMDNSNLGREEQTLGRFSLRSYERKIQHGRSFKKKTVAFSISNRIKLSRDKDLLTVKVV